MRIQNNMRLAVTPADGPPSLVFKEPESENSLKVPKIDADTVAEVRMLRSHLQELLLVRDGLVQWNICEGPNSTAIQRDVDLYSLDAVGLSVLRDIFYRVVCKLKEDDKKMVSVLPLRSSDWTDEAFRFRLLEATDCVHNAVVYASRTLLWLFAWMADKELMIAVNVQDFVSFYQLLLSA